MVAFSIEPTIQANNGKIVAGDFWATVAATEYSLVPWRSPVRSAHSGSIFLKRATCRHFREARYRKILQFRCDTGRLECWVR